MTTAKAISLRCERGHAQRISFSPPMPENEAHDFGVMLAGGTLRSLCVEMPGYPCSWSENGDPPCGAKISFALET